MKKGIKVHAGIATIARKMEDEDTEKGRYK